MSALQLQGFFRARRRREAVANMNTFVTVRLFQRKVLAAIPIIYNLLDQFIPGEWF